MLSHSISLADEADTIRLGGVLALATSTLGDHELMQENHSLLKTQGGIIYLRGDLGAGKTTLSRGLLRGYGYQGAVKSPTYTLVEPYENSAGNIYHFDLYRLMDPEEVEYLGVEDYFSPANLCLVEWPERGVRLIPAADVVVELGHCEVGRNLVLTTASARGENIYCRVLQLLGK